MSLAKSTVAQLKDLVKSKGLPVPNLLKADLVDYATVVNDATPEQLEEWKTKNTNYVVHYESVALRDEYRGDDLPFEEMVDLRLQHLYTYGWTVMPKVPEFEPADVFAEMLEWFKLGNPVLDTSKYTEWKDAHIASRLHGIVKQRSGHEAWHWNIRKLYKKYFDILWQTDDLLCSFDGWNFSTKSGKKRGLDPELGSVSRGWMHIDQTRFDREFRCVQGLVCITDVEPEDNSLIVLEGSHHLFDDYLDQRPLEGWEWCFIDGNVTLKDYPAPIKDILHQKISARAGELILWDSRLMHQAGDLSHSNVRAAVYVSMMPAVSCSDADRQRRIETFEANKMTGHWCYDLHFDHRTVKAFSVNSDFMMRFKPKHLPPFRELDPEVLNDSEVRKMVGYLD